MLWGIGILIMMCDHMGAYMLTGDWASICRLIGRAGLLIWPYLTAAGMMRTRDREGYALRWIVLALVSEGPYWMLTGHWGSPMIALGVGALGVLAVIKRDEKWLWGVFAVGLVVSMYGIYWPYMVGPPIMAIFTTYKNDEISMKWGGVMLVAIMAGADGWPQWLGMCGLPLIEMEDRLPRWDLPKMLKYGVYPGHLVVLAGTKAIMGM